VEYHIKLPLDRIQIQKMHAGDILYISGTLFTARDEAHKKLLEQDQLPFNPSEMALYHCGPLMKKEKGVWNVVSAGPTTSSRMELYENKLIKKYRINLIIGKGGMGEKTEKALQKYGGIYTSYTGGAGALAANYIEKVKNVYWLEELGMVEAVWILQVKNFGPLIVAMDSYGNSLYKKVSEEEK
jgi:tartrate/fumarate subfamily iron-sulfur-dependent hydro-lyase beta chain